jgi:hypothetical protein
MSANLNGDNKMTEIYSAAFLVSPIFIDDEPRWKLSKFHVTYHYNPGSIRYPPGVHRGDWMTIKHHGIYDDGEVLASKVSLHNISSYDSSSNSNGLYRQRDTETPLHITWDSGELPPIEGGIRLMNEDYCEDYYHSFNDINEYYHSFGDDEVKRLKYKRIMGRMDTIGMWNCFKN